MNDLTRTATLPAFTQDEHAGTKARLASKVATMMGRKLEEGDWTAVYCAGKKIPEQNWSNLSIDVNHDGLGVEMKLLRRSVREGSIRSVCGTTLMHPAATRSIRIDDLNEDPDVVMREVIEQYNALVRQRTSEVRRGSSDGRADMRVGWLLWETSLSEFLYFEQRLSELDPDSYYAIWNETPAQGARKSSKSLWIYEKDSQQKRYSVTTSAGIKIQPYFDVPPPADPNLYYFRVQSERIDADTVNLWVSYMTAQTLKEVVGSLDKEDVSSAIIRVAELITTEAIITESDEQEAVAISVSAQAFDVLSSTWDSVSDEHLVQILVGALRSTR